MTYITGMKSTINP